MGGKNKKKAKRITKKNKRNFQIYKQKMKQRTKQQQ